MIVSGQAPDMTAYKSLYSKIPKTPAKETGYMLEAPDFSEQYASR